MAQYKIYGTNQPYTGKVVTLGNRLYTTIGGTLEGNSHEVVLSSEGGNKTSSSFAGAKFTATCTVPTQATS